MAHGKETPRQKMIGMMYLVLTALLALNVSKTVLDSFVLVDNSLTVTTDNFNIQNEKLNEEFAKAAVSNPTKVKPWKDKADEVIKESEELFNYINSLKIEIVRLADGKKAVAVEQRKIRNKNEVRVDAGKIDNKDNTDKPAQIMVGDNNNGKAKILKNKIIQYRNKLISFTNKKDVGIQSSLNKNLDTADPPAEEGTTESWESYHFEHLPLIAVTTILSKMQSDVRNAESDMLRYLFNKIDAGSIKFNKLEATVIPNSNYILKGNEYKAQVFIAATDTIEKPEVYIGPYKTVVGPDGKVDYEMIGNNYEKVTTEEGGKKVYKRICNTVGKQKWGGIIVLKTSDGETISKNFDIDFMVAETNVVVSPTKMNVLYVGVDNPISISIPSIPDDKITATMSNGIIRRNTQGPGWIANLTSLGNNKTNIIVSAEIEKGRPKVMGSIEFRVRPIPDPIPKVAGRKGGSIDRNLLMAQMVLNADLENFEFDAQFRVIEFTVSASIHGFLREETSKSNRITDAQKEIFRSANKGDKIYFQDIKAVGPDGKPRDLTTLYFKIQ